MKKPSSLILLFLGLLLLAVSPLRAQTAATEPKAKQYKAEDFIDPTFYNELEKATSLNP